MEKFEQLAPKVDCNAKDGEMSLTFKDKQAYDYALSKWSYINQNKDDRFLLIANHDGCGPDDERQPYYISNVKDDFEHMIVYLEAQEAKWSDVAGTYSLNWGHTRPLQHDRLKSRDWWDDVKGSVSSAVRAASGAIQSATNSITDSVTGAQDLSQTVTFPVSAGTPNLRTSLYRDPGKQLSVDCINCSVSGAFKATGHLKIKDLKAEELSIDVSPSSFAAAVELEATITASTNPVPLSYETQLFSAPIPGAGITVPNIFTLGAVFSYSIGINTTISGSGTVDFGVSATIPDSASAKLDLSGASSSKAKGWDAKLTPLFNVSALSASVTVAATSKPSLDFALELINIGKAKLGLALDLPEVSSTLSAKYAAGGVCPSDAKKTTTGIESKSDVKLAVTVDADANFDIAGGVGLPSWSKELWSKVFPLPGACWPILIQGLGPSSSPVSSKVGSAASSKASVAKSSATKSIGARAAPQSKASTVLTRKSTPIETTTATSTTSAATNTSPSAQPPAGGIAKARRGRLAW